MLPRTLAGLLCPILVLLSSAAAAAELSFERALDRCFVEVGKV